MIPVFDECLDGFNNKRKDRVFVMDSLKQTNAPGEIPDTRSLFSGQPRSIFQNLWTKSFLGFDAPLWIFAPIGNQEILGHPAGETLQTLGVSSHRAF